MLFLSVELPKDTNCRQLLTHQQAAFKLDCKAAKQCVQHKLGIALRHKKLKCREVRKKRKAEKRLHLSASF